MKEQLQNPVFKTLSELADKNDFEVFVIGGFVRDLIMERNFKNDIDILVIGSGIAFAELVAEHLNTKVSVFKNFGTAMIRYEDLDIEFVGARKESYRSDSRKPIVEDGTLSDDQLRRDFTINAMALSLNEKSYGELLDPFDGLKDIREKCIRTPLNPAETFSDDPLRMMRAIRFACQLQFDIDPLALEAITKNKDRIKIVSKERILDELQKIVAADKPSVGFGHLFDTGLLKLIFPAMANLYGVDTINGKSHKDNFYHTLEVLEMWPSKATTSGFAGQPLCMISPNRLPSDLMKCRAGHSTGMKTAARRWFPAYLRS